MSALAGGVAFVSLELVSPPLETSGSTLDVVPPDPQLASTSSASVITLPVFVTSALQSSCPVDTCHARERSDLLDGHAPAEHARDHASLRHPPRRQIRTLHADRRRSRSCRPRALAQPDADHGERLG